MLKLLFGLIKMTFFAVAVLLAAHTVRWDGRTLSDRIRASLARTDVDRSMRRASRWTRDVMDDAREGARRLREPSAERSREARPLTDRMTASAAAPENEAAPRAAAREAGSNSEEIVPSERAKLRALIRDLNHGR